MAAQEAVGRPLPPDLRAWWLYADGAHSGLQVDGGWLIPPGFVPYPIGEPLESRRLWMDGGPRNGCVMEFHRDTGALAHWRSHHGQMWPTCSTTLPSNWRKARRNSMTQVGSTGHDVRLGQGLISLQSPSEMTSTVPSTTLMAVLSSMA